MKWFSKISPKRKNEVFGLMLFVLALFALLSFATHTQGDDRWIKADADEIWVENYYPRNLAGSFGALVSYVTFECLGWSAWLMAIVMGTYGVKRFFLAKENKPMWIASGIWGAVFLFGIIIDLPAAKSGVAWAGGVETISGWWGRLLAEFFSGILGVAGGILVLGSVLLAGIYWSVPWRPKNVPLPAWLRKPKSAAKTKRREQRSLTQNLRTFFQRLWAVVPHRQKSTDPSRVADADAPADLFPPPSPVSAVDEPAGVMAAEAADFESSDEIEDAAPRRSLRLVRRAERASDPNFSFPSIELLQPARNQGRRRLDTQGPELLLKALKTFDIGVDGEIQSYPGPVITRYEFRPAAGIKVNQVVGLADDLALALSASRVRVVAPVPGKSVVGIEIPNADPELVPLSAVLQDKSFSESNAILPLALGVTIEGHPFVADLASMPHLLIAGSTGSGKSVCINVIITSILYRHHPRDVRLLFIDPKMLELSMYQGIPHLDRPVVTQPRGAERLLADAVREMEERYKTLAAAGVRNIGDYNRQIDPEKRLPYLVIVVDELADLMMSQSAARIEMLITRLAQMARAVGIHLILATQRPSVDVITGLIKANFSSRIAFQVATKVDSRTVLDANGAEKLIGRGDMLFLAPGQPEAMRVHGAYISSEESSALVEFLRSQNPNPQPATPAESIAEDEESDEDDDHGDLLFNQAAELVVRHKQGSVSLLQRRLGVGYQRAARLIDRLEEAGVVGPYDGSKAREVLWTQADYEEKFARSVN
ncbi:MAG: DNA translocase FtsK 4TM domain-containing protein [candidate division Zixibacteria bacterium]|nr:DNA translocase FtsK 4TM domain-containing protein [candidate division Zixibacteria bacterium]